MKATLSHSTPLMHNNSQRYYSLGTALALRPPFLTLTFAFFSYFPPNQPFPPCSCLTTSSSQFEHAMAVSQSRGEALCGSRAYWHLQWIPAIHRFHLLLFCCVRANERLKCVKSPWGEWITHCWCLQQGGRLEGALSLFHQLDLFWPAGSLWMSNSVTTCATAQFCFGKSCFIYQEILSLWPTRSIHNILRV